VAELSVFDDGTAAAPSITFTGDLDTGIYSPGANQVAISTNGTERVEFGTSEVVFNDGGENYDFRIEGDTEANLFFVDASTDRVGLGTSSPQELLDIDSGRIKLTNNSITGYIGSPSAGTFQVAIDTGDLTFHTSGYTERLRITSNGYARLASGTGGIQFNGDTAAANALDDYEEGTWTPAFTFATPGDLAVTYVYQVGNYRIIGKLCIATFTLEFTPTYTTSSGSARITGLPLSFGNYLATPASVDRFSGFTLTAGFDNMWLRKSTSLTLVELYSMGRSGSLVMGTSEVVSGSAKILNGTIIYNL
jgi:hypothetical protein